MATHVTVERAPADRSMRKLGAITVGLLVLLGLRWWFGAPTAGSTSASGVESDGPITCDVSHDGLLYLAHEDSFSLDLGDMYRGRFGPHDVRASFFDDTPSNTFEVEVASRQIGTMGTIGVSNGNKKREFHVTQGPGYGKLLIDCAVPGP